MRLAVIVSEFPKTSETFVMRDLLSFHELGAEIRLYYLAPYRHSETLHDFARPVLDWVHHERMLLSRRVLGGAARTLVRPGALRAVIGDMVRGYAREPELLAKSLALLPKISAIAEDMAAWGADHVHAAFAAHPATAAWAVRRLTGIPYSVSCHAHDIFTTQAFLPVKLGEAAFVRAISDYNRDFLLRHVPGLRPDQIRVIHCGLDLQALQPLPPAPRGPDFNILFIGRLVPQKGVDVLLRALALPEAGPDWRLDILGDGPERAALEGLCRQLGLEGRVRWHGNQPFESIARALAAAHVLATPSIIGPGGRTEGIPTVLMEALALHRPVIASQVSGIPELVVHGRTGLLVPPGDAAALAGALRAIALDPPRAAAMAEAGRKLVEQEFDLRVNAGRQLQAMTHHARFNRFQPEAAE